MLGSTFATLAAGLLAYFALFGPGDLAPVDSTGVVRAAATAAPPQGPGTKLQGPSSLSGGGGGGDGGCTAYGVVHAQDPTVWWGGCPSNNCQAGQTPCQRQEITDVRWTCLCGDGSTGACQSKVTVDSEGESTGWSCKNHGCANSCTTQGAPNPPQTGSTYFWFCYC